MTSDTPTIPENRRVTSSFEGRLKQGVLRSEDYGILKDQLEEFASAYKEVNTALRLLRRNLLLAGLIALIVGRTNLVPSKIETLGITFDGGQQTQFRYIIGVVVLYFVLSFSKELLRRWGIITKYKDVEKNLKRYRDVQFDQSAMQALAFLPVSTKLSLTTEIIEFLVDYVIPYYIAISGLAACYHWFPDRWFVF